MRVLAIDTALGACSACVLDGAILVANETMLMERGHAEALLPMVDRVVSRAEGGFAGLDRVAVTVGPGSFTGLRVGIAAARAIGLAAGIPVVGVATLSAFLAPLMAGRSNGVLAAAIDAKHGQIYVQVIAPGGRSIVAPTLLPVRDVVRLLGSGPVIVSGSGSPALAAEAWTQGVETHAAEATLAPDIAWVAKLGMLADPTQALPKPLYLRGPDAKPQDSARIARR